MRQRALLALLVLALGACASNGNSRNAIVDHVIDGDTIVLEDGRHVRLVQLDAPEVSDRECYGDEATGVLRRLLPSGTHVDIEQDPALDQVDRYGRTLAYVVKDGLNVNLELVRLGAAAPWFFDGDRGRYAARLLLAAKEAKRSHRGLWAACPHTVLDPLHGIEAEP
jgi:micrococcal nuclease